MSKVKLTKKSVEAQAPEDKDIVLYDTLLSGFQCKITPRGRRIYSLYYRTKENRERRPKIGAHGEVTCEQARKIAEEMKGEIAKGRDPGGEKRDFRRSPTVSNLCARYLKEHAEPRKKESSLRNDRQMIQRFVVPKLGTMRVAAVTSADIGNIHRSLGATRYQANRLLALLSKMFSLAEKWGDRSLGSNPAHGIEKYPEEKSQRYLSEEEWGTLADAIRRAEADGTTAPQVTAALKLLMFTGCRKEEILSLRWENIDWERAQLKLVDTKTGASARTVGEPVLELLRSLPWRQDSPWVIPSDSDPMKRRSTIDKAWRKLRSKAGLNDLRIHDLRHSFGSIAVGSGKSLPMIGDLLGHSQAATTQRYAHIDNDPARTAANDIAGTISRKINGEP